MIHHCGKDWVNKNLQILQKKFVKKIKNDNLSNL